MHHNVALIIQYLPWETGHSLFQVQFALSSHVADLPVPKKKSVLQTSYPCRLNAWAGWTSGSESARWNSYN